MDGTVDCPGQDDDSPANDGISACYNPSDIDPPQCPVENCGRHYDNKELMC